MDFVQLQDLARLRDFGSLLATQSYKRHHSKTQRAPLVKPNRSCHAAISGATGTASLSSSSCRSLLCGWLERVKEAGLVPETLMPDEKVFLEQEGITLTPGKAPQMSQKVSAFERGHACISRPSYLRLRDIIVSLFYWTPKQHLSLERLAHFIRVRNLILTTRRSLTIPSARGLQKQ